MKPVQYIYLLCQKVGLLSNVNLFSNAIALLLQHIMAWFAFIGRSCDIFHLRESKLNTKPPLTAVCSSALSITLTSPRFHRVGCRDYGAWVFISSRPRVRAHLPQPFQVIHTLQCSLSSRKFLHSRRKLFSFLTPFPPLPESQRCIHAYV